MVRPVPSTFLMSTTKSPTSFRTLTLAAAVSLALVACGGSDSSSDAGDSATTAPVAAETTAAETTAPETTAAAEPVTPEALTVESGFASGIGGIGVRNTSVAAVVTNTAGSTACGVKLQFTLLDAAGAELDTQTAKVQTLPAGAALAVVPNALDTGDAEPASLEATVVSLDECAADVAVSVLETADAAVDADVKYVTGTLINSSDAAVEETTVVCVLRDADSAIVGGAKTVVREAIEPAAAAEFKVRLVWAPGTAASAACTATA